MIKQLCLVYENSVTQLKYPELYAIACFVLDFLCIHPFRDGNGRVSRLLTLLALYEHGYQVGKYISIERIVEESKETYYETLNKSSQKWHQSKHDCLPWFNYFLGTILSAYKEFEARAGNIKPARGAKTEIIEKAIDQQIGEFTMNDILRSCPSVSRPMIRVVLEEMRKKGSARVVGIGRGARWRKT
jgi:Fic family protein